MESTAVQPESKTNKGGKNGFLIFLMIVAFFIFGLIFCALVFAFAVMSSGSTNKSWVSSEWGNELELKKIAGADSDQQQILVVPINGVILDNNSQDSLSFFTTAATYGYEIKDILHKAAAEGKIKAVLLEINSPGGTITGSKAIADGVAYYRQQTGKPVYAHIMGMGASGAYWSAASSDYIIADAGSLVGSIGVILGPFKYYKNVIAEQSGLDSVTTSGGIETYYITSGSSKDVGSSDRQMSTEERKILQTGTDDAYQEFVSFISERRNISKVTITDKIKALPYGEQQALKLGLIDKTGSLDDAFTLLAEKAGLDEGYQVIRVQSKSDFWSLLLSGKLLLTINQQANIEQDLTRKLSGRMLYLFDGGRYLP